MPYAQYNPSALLKDAAEECGELLTFNGKIVINDILDCSHKANGWERSLYWYGNKVKGCAVAIEEPRARCYECSQKRSALHARKYKIPPLKRKIESVSALCKELFKRARRCIMRSQLRQIHFKYDNRASALYEPSPATEHFKLHTFNINLYKVGTLHLFIKHCYGDIAARDECIRPGISSIAHKDRTAP